MKVEKKGNLVRDKEISSYENSTVYNTLIKDNIYIEKILLLLDAFEAIKNSLKPSLQFLQKRVKHTSVKQSLY